MRKALHTILIPAAFVTCQATAQIVVSDPAALTQSILNSSEQVAEQAATTEQVALAFREARRIRELQSSFQEALRRVSEAVASSARIASTVSSIADMTRIYTSAMSTARGSAWMTADETGALAEAFVRLLRSGEEALADLKRVVTAGTMSMSDADRLDRIDRIASRVEHLHQAASTLGRHMESVASVREYLGSTSSRAYGYMNR